MPGRIERPGADRRLWFGLWWLGLVQTEPVLGSGRMVCHIDRRLACTMTATAGGDAIGTGWDVRTIWMAVVGARFGCVQCVSEPCETRVTGLQTQSLGVAGKGVWCHGHADGSGWCCYRMGLSRLSVVCGLLHAVIEQFSGGLASLAAQGPTACASSQIAQG